MVGGLHATSTVQQKRDSLSLRVRGAKSVRVHNTVGGDIRRSVQLSDAQAYDDIDEPSESPSDAYEFIDTDEEERKDLKKYVKTAEACMDLTAVNRGIKNEHGA